jgi:hypothetical protein
MMADDGCMPEVDDDQLAALRRLRAAFGAIEIIEVVNHDPAAAPGESIEGARMADGRDPRRMTPEEQEQAHALLTQALSDPDWRTASQALDDLMGQAAGGASAAGGRGAPHQAGATGRPDVTADGP